MSLYYSDKIKSTDSSKYGIVDATEVSGHRRVNTLQELYQISDTILSQSGNNANNDALGQVWYVHEESSDYTLINWDSRNNSDGWKKIIPGTITEVNQGTSNTTCTISPNTFYVWDTVSNLNITLGAETNGVANEYLFQFTSGSTATTLELPDSIKWTNDNISIEANKTYQISILKGLGSILGFNNA